MKKFSDANAETQVVPRLQTERLRPDASYMVVGGFGGIGRSVCRWMVERGAKHLVVVSRSAGDGKAQDLRDELGGIASGVTITPISCDISHAAQLKTSLDVMRKSGTPPIRGVVHGGMDLQVCPDRMYFT